MNHIYIEPGKSNSSGDDVGHWKIMIEENGVSRHLNDADCREDADLKAQRAASKRGISVEGVVHTPGEPTPVVVKKKNYMDVVPPRGAPKKGAVVQFMAPDGSKYEGEVVDYLAEQFIIEYMAPTQRVIHVNEDWKSL